MAENTTVNKVVINNETVIDITDTTATPGTVANGQVFYKASGERAVGSMVETDPVFVASPAYGIASSDITNWDSKVGEDVSGQTFTVDGAQVTAGTGAERFNDYTNNIATGNLSHAEGSQTQATGVSSHAEGYKTKATGLRSHAEGSNTTASGLASHAEGSGTIASSSYQHVQGKYNIEDANSTYAHIVGNGNSSTRANIHTLDWNGVAWYKGGVKVGGTSAADATELTPGIEKFLITVTEGQDGLVTDKTYAEIVAAYNNGDVLELIDPANYVYRLVAVYEDSDTVLVFNMITVDTDDHGDVNQISLSYFTIESSGVSDQSASFIIPSKTSDLTNDSGFITSSDIPVTSVNNKTGAVEISKGDLGLGNVENKSSSTIRSELTQSNVTTALGYTPYTPAEVDALVSAVFHYKGTKATYAEVAALTGMKVGDVWQVTADNSEYVYNGSAWEKLGPTIDLSGYLTSVSVAGQTLTPSSNAITAAQLKTALGLGSAAYVNTESTLTNGSNLPTGAAVKSFVEGKGYTTNTGTITGVSVNGTSIATSGVANVPVPTKVSDLTNDSGYITSYTETDPTVPSWAKQSTKPTYTASEVGALPDTATYVSSFNGSTGDVTFSAPVTSVNGATGAVKATYYVTLTYNSSSSTFTASATSSEVYAAYEAGYDVYALYSNFRWRLVGVTSSAFTFSREIAKSIRMITWNRSTETITADTYYTFQTTDNKVTSISSASTDAQYPSAKLLYDTVTNLESQIPTKTSDLTNDSGFLTSHQPVVQTLTSGTAIGSVGGTVLYAPSGGGGSSSPEIYIGSTTPSGYTMWIDPDGMITDGNEVGY